MTRRGARIARRACATRRGERLLRGAIAVLLAAFAVGSLDNLLFAVPAAICSSLLAVSAITGWCPIDLGARRPAEDESNAFGYPDARERIPN
ncbi:YgaP family membrane protein [Agromyces lapidis]|uniref:DUF2892 domain-containing protein n=1 Tax=Agromyces lapidis TaxID=279574 RepID=A0ABV5SPU3_9MICO|nr:DUF2892 domain-containing protein [Agromyces lapidis]